MTRGHPAGADERLLRLILAAVPEFTQFYGYAPDSLDIALRLGYKPSSVRKACAALRLAGKIQHTGATRWQLTEP